MKRKRHYNIHGRGGKADFEAQYKRPGRLRPVQEADEHAGFFDFILALLSLLAAGAIIQIFNL